MGLKFEILKRSGAWFYYNDERLGQGRDNVKQLLADNPELSDEIQAKIIDKYNAVMNPKAAAAAEKEETIEPVDPADLEPADSKIVNIDIAVDD